MAEKVLIAFASKHGSTAEIAERIAEVLRTDGIQVDLACAEETGALSDYTAVILGSAVYTGRWRKQAVSFLQRHEKELATKKVWLFSSGPTDDEEHEEPINDWTFPKNVQQMAERIYPLDIEVFHGVLDADKLGFFERWMIKMAKAPIGDFRDWDDIEGWAGYIADELSGVTDDDDADNPTDSGNHVSESIEDGLSDDARTDDS